MKWRRVLFRVLMGVLALFPAYALAALIGGLIPTNSGWREAEPGIPIFVRSNGVHTWVMVPTVAEGVDWRSIAPSEHIPDPRYAGDYIAFGFGNREFYLNTPTWGDLSLRTAIAAAIGGGPSLMHVDHGRRPRSDRDHRAIFLTPDEYRGLSTYIRESFELDADGRSRPLIGQGYGPSDVFYESRRPYHFIRTCNQWTGEALRAAGVRTGVWTPLEQSIMWRLPLARQAAAPSR